MPSNDSALAVYLAKIAERRTLLQNARALHDELFELNGQLKTQTQFIVDTKDEIRILFDSEPVNLSHYRDYKAMLTDAEYLSDQITGRIYVAQDQLKTVEDAIEYVEANLQALKQHLKPGKVLNFERDRSQTQDCA